MNGLINTVIWGKYYVSDYLRYSLPSLFSAGNLEDTEVCKKVTFHIMSTSEDFEVLNASPIYKNLKNIVKVIETTIESVDMLSKPDTYKYDRISSCQTSSIDIAIKNKFDAILFLYPDFIFSKQSLSGIFLELENKAECVLCQIPFISHDRVKSGLFREHGYETLNKNGYRISIDQRNLVKLNIDNPHTVNLGFDVNGKNYGEWPGSFIWNIEGEGQLIRSFHWHPLAISLKSNESSFLNSFRVSLDDEFISKAFSPLNILSFISDSDIFAICSLRYENDPPHVYPGNRLDQRRIVIWAEEHSTSMLRYFLTKDCFWHFEEMQSSKWADFKLYASKYFKKIIDLLNRPDVFLNYEDNEAYKARLKRIKRGY